MNPSGTALQHCSKNVASYLGVDEAGRLPSVAAVGTKEVRLVASVSRGTTVVVELKELLN